MLEKRGKGKKPKGSVAFHPRDRIFLFESKTRTNRNTTSTDDRSKHLDHQNDTHRFVLRRKYREE